MTTELVVLRVLPEHRDARGLYWRPEGRGYTFDLDQAGHFDPRDLPHSDRAEPVSLPRARDEHRQAIADVADALNMPGLDEVSS